MHENRNELFEEHKVKLDARTEECGKFYDNSIKIYHEVSDIQLEFQRKCRKYLYKLIQNEQDNITSQ